MIFYGVYNPFLVRIVSNVIMYMCLSFRKAYWAVFNVRLEHFLMESIVNLSHF